MSIWTKEIDRRTLLKGAGLVTGLAAIGAVDGFYIEPKWLDVTRHTLEVEGLAQRLQGYRLAQITDVHLTSYSKLHDDLVAAVDAYSPQLVVITGDLFDERTALDDAEHFCARLATPGRIVVATLGNWEHWSGLPITEIRTLYERHGIALLVNEHRMVGDGVVVAGTDDGSIRRADLRKTCQALTPGDLKVLLTHAPGVLEEYPEEAPRFDLTLSGHTHGGQITLAGFAPLRPPGSGSFVAGAYQTRAGFAYVSRGIGTSLVPARFFCRPELAFFEFIDSGR